MEDAAGILIGLDGLDDVGDVALLRLSHGRVVGMNKITWHWDGSPVPR